MFQLPCFRPSMCTPDIYKGFKTGRNPPPSERTPTNYIPRRSAAHESKSDHTKRGSTGSNISLSVSGLHDKLGKIRTNPEQANGVHSILIHVVVKFIL